MLQIWRSCKRQVNPNSIYHTVFMNSLHNFSLHLCEINFSTHSFSVENLADISFRKTFSTLTPQAVQSTLKNCSSDVIALSFFLWCAKNPNYFHDRASFNHMVSVVNRLTDRFTTLRGILKELKSVGCIVKPQTFLILLRIYWRGDMYGSVLEVFEEMISSGYTPNTFAYNVMIDVLFKIGRANDALKVLREIQVPNFLSLNITISHLCKLNDFLNIQEVFRIMLRERYYPNDETYEQVLNSFCKVGKLREALQVLSLMITLGIHFSVVVWSILIDGFCKFDRLSMAGDLFVKMVQLGYSPNVVTYTSLIKGFMESQNVDMALSILRIMESNGCVPDLIFCNMLINGLYIVGRYDDAFRIFLDLKQRNLEPDCYTFSSILSTTCKSQKFHLLSKLIKGFVIEADIVVCNSFLFYLCKAGFSSYAVIFYNDMIERDLIPDQYTYVGLLVALCKGGRVEDAVDVYHGIVMSYSNLDSHVHTVIIDGLINVGNFHQAISLFRNAVKEKYRLDVVSYTVAIVGLIKIGRFDEACTLYCQMKNIGLDPNRHTYNVMISCFCKKRDVKMVTEMLQEIIGKGIELEFGAFIRVIKLNKSNSHDVVFDLLIKMWDLGLIPNKAKNLLFEGFLNENARFDQVAVSMG